MNKKNKLVLYLKYGIVAILYKFFIFCLKLSGKNIKVHDIKTTVKLIKENNLSVGRYGDGEFKWLFGKRESNNFEKNSEKLSIALKRVLGSERTDFKIGIPDIFNGIEKYRTKSGVFWGSQLLKHGIRWTSVLKSDYQYFDSLVTRPYIIYKNKNQSTEIFDIFKSIWNKKNVLIVEGSKTRFGIGDDLLDNTQSVKRIICPAVGAFDYYETILLEVQNYVKNVSDKNNLIVLISLGPTATVLAHDISLESVQAIDIGHLDIEYYWFLHKMEDKSKVPYKYVNEVSNGNNVSPLPTKLQSQYENQIIKTISVEDI